MFAHVGHSNDPPNLSAPLISSAPIQPAICMAPLSSRGASMKDSHSAGEGIIFLKNIKIENPAIWLCGSAKEFGLKILKNVHDDNSVYNFVWSIVRELTSQLPMY